MSMCFLCFRLHQGHIVRHVDCGPEKVRLQQLTPDIALCWLRRVGENDTNVAKRVSSEGLLLPEIDWYRFLFWIVVT